MIPNSCKAAIISVLLLMGMQPLGHRLMAEDNCEAEIADPPVTIRLTEDSKEIKFLKKLEKKLERLPFVKKAALSITGDLSYHHGMACCPGTHTPTPYTDFQGKFTGSLDLQFAGIGIPHVKFELDIPIPFTGIDVFGIISGELDLSVGGELALAGTIVGRDSDCTCVIVKGDGSATPKICGTLEGHIAVGYTDSFGTPHSIIKGLEGSVCISTVYSVSATRQFGHECTEEETKACIASPILDFEADVKLFFGLSTHLEKSINLDDLLGLDNPTCL